MGNEKQHLITSKWKMDFHMLTSTNDIRRVKKKLEDIAEILKKLSLKSSNLYNIEKSIKESLSKIGGFNQEVKFNNVDYPSDLAQSILKELTKIEKHVQSQITQQKHDTIKIIANSSHKLDSSFHNEQNIVADFNPEEPSPPIQFNESIQYSDQNIINDQKPTHFLTNDQSLPITDKQDLLKEKAARNHDKILPVRKIDFYMSFPDYRGYFPNVVLHTKFKSDSFYEFSYAENDRNSAYFRIISERITWALSQVDNSVKPVSDDLNKYFRGTNLELLDEGVVVLRGDKWIVEKTMKVKIY